MNLSQRLPFSRTALIMLLTAFCAAGLPQTAAAQDDNSATTAPIEAPPAEAVAPTEPAPSAENSADASTAETATEPEVVQETIVVDTTTESTVAETAEETPADGSAVKLSTVEVTGSRLKRTDYESAQPVTVIKREDIARSGLTNIGDLLMRISAAGTSINTTAGTIFLSGGESNLDLRNLGTDRVLVLVNGHRWVNGLTSTSTSSVDLNTIPTSIIERVEVLKDGASAIYGSDAIAGVVNIITRKNYSGAEFSSQYGRYQQGDGAIQQHEISLGTAGANTSLFANLSYTRQDVVKTTTREISESPGFGLGRSRWNRFGPEGGFIFIPTPATYALLGPDKCPFLDIGAGAGGIPLCDVVHNAGEPGATPLNYHKYDQEVDSYNRFTDSNLQNPSERIGVFTQLTQKVTDSISFNFEGLFNKTKAESQLRPQALLAGDLAGNDIYASVTNRYNPFGQDIGRGVPTGFCDPTSPLANDTLCGEVGTDALVGEGIVVMRLLDFPVITNYDVDTLRLGGAFNGSFDLFSQFFSWDAGYSYGSNRKTERRQGDYRTDRLKLALGPDADCTGTCVPFNVFAGQEGITQEMVDYLAIHAVNHSKQRQDDVSVNFATDLGPVRLPAGPIALAFGGEYRRQMYEDSPDAILVAGLSSGNNSQPTKGENSVREAFVELGVPLLSDLPLINQLDLSLAGRYSDYGDFGTSTTGKVGVRWKVYDDLLLRSTYSSAFRAPSLGELFLGDSDSFDQLADPCVGGEGSQRNDPTTDANCNADGVPATTTDNAQVKEIRGGNQDLNPETAHTLTAGLVFSPSFVPNLNISVDYYTIQLRDFITIAGGQFILDSCYNGEERSLCEFIHRGPNRSLDFVEDRYLNFSGLETAGIDGGIDFGLPLPPSFGRVKLLLDASYLIQYDQILPVPGGGDTTSGAVGQSGGFVFIPRWKANAELIWKQGQFTASWATRMVYHVRESCVDFVPSPPLFPGQSLADLGVCSDPKVQTNPDGSTTDVSENVLPTHFYHDIRIGYELAESKVDMALGVKNVLNKQPPASYDPSTGGAYFNYNVLSEEIPGRFFYVRIGMKY